jgi:hypothetical protein
MTYRVLLVTDHAGSFVAMVSKPVARFIEGGQIMVTTLATFDCEEEAVGFLRALQGIEVQKRERTPQDIETLERHGLSAVPPPGSIVRTALEVHPLPAHGALAEVRELPEGK